ncbi:hypothetical protein P154DRAFT_563177 [Amniculicola lignicola CBS 123094]|uniref:RTA1-domain-containing protein n=1 Tax=Amniculicola lignicola CBS 123094 TaxID=1392246 RepID=A0A6A5WFN4_9PLEO|nr:hypothetical protein P154DRAFT_563177 [Amniculicola lignicola CBS 123094]
MSDKLSSKLSGIESFDLPKTTMSNISKNAKGFDLAANPFVYNSSPIANILWVPMFGLMSIFLTYQFFKYRAWNFWPLTLGLFVETIALLLRATCTRSNNLDVYNASTILILSTPAFLSLTLIQAYSRLEQYLNPASVSSSSFSIFFSSVSLPAPKQLFTRALTTLAFVAWTIQIISTGLLSQHFTTIAKPGTFTDVPAVLRKIEDMEKGWVAGLSVQALCIAVLMMAAMYSLFTAHKSTVQVLAQRKAADIEGMGIRDAGVEMEDYRRQKARTLFVPIVTGAALLLIRTTFSFFNHSFSSAGARKSYLNRNEWCFFIFDAMPVLLFSVLFALYHPGRLLPRELIGWWVKQSGVVGSRV